MEVTQENAVAKTIIHKELEMLQEMELENAK